jgi:hypothetical protein
MAPPIIFARTVTLGVAGPTLDLTSIPQTADHLFFRIRARKDVDIINDEFLGLRVNANATGIYSGHASQATTATFNIGVGGDGVLNDTEMAIAELATNEGSGGVFQELFGWIARYTEAENHVLHGFGTSMDGPLIADVKGHRFNYVINDASAITQLNLFNEPGDDFAIGTEISVWGMAGVGDIATVARSAQAGAPNPVIDFAGDSLKDYTVTAAVLNSFSASNPRLGRTIKVNLTGGDGASTIAFPVGTEVLENNYVAGADAWLIIECVDEAGPEFIANLKDVV